MMAFLLLFKKYVIKIRYRNYRKIKPFDEVTMSDKESCPENNRK